MPCQFACEGRCSHSFRCKVLRDFESGALTRDEAQEKVRTPLTLRADFEICDAIAVRLSERIRLRHELVEWSEARRLLLLKMAALD